MKATILCSECTHSRNHYGHGENWDYCNHKKTNEVRGTYGTMLDRLGPSTAPKWCFRRTILGKIRYWIIRILE